MHEIELKFVLDEQTEKMLRENPALSRLAGGKPATASLHTIYYDTPGRALKAAKIALRLRKEGRSWVQTVKAGGVLRSGLSTTVEVESTVPRGELDLALLPDPAVRAEVEAHLGDAVPEAVCETVIRRTTYQLETADGARIELAIDAGEIRAQGRTEPWREAELELKSGVAAALFDAARQLLPEGGLEFSNLSKAQRGYMLAEEGRVSPPVEPRSSRPVELTKKMTLEQAAEAVLHECVDQVSANMLAILRTDAPEGPHQLRVGLRRLRTGLVTFRDVIGGEPLKRLADEARWLGQEVGRQRDLDVMVEDIVEPEAEKHPGDKGFAKLIRELESAGEKERLRLRETLKSARAHAFLFDLAAFSGTQGWRRPGDGKQAKALAAPVAKQARKSLAACWRRVAKRARGIEDLSVEARHELRKSLKRLRYMTEFLASLYPEERLVPFLASMKALQDQFGFLNDAALAEDVLAGPGAPASRDAAAQRAAGRVLGARECEAEHAWEAAKADWAALESAGRFWK